MPGSDTFAALLLGLLIFLLLLQKFTGATGRYGTKQVNLPVSVAANCLRLQVESSTPSLTNAGLRWELLGCNTGIK